MPHLLNLPTELLERILALLCHENAQTIQACHQACRTLNVIIAHSQLVQYLERVALLGVYDPSLIEELDASATLSLVDRVAVLRAWEDSWNAFTGGHDDDAGVFWQKRRPNLRIASPALPSARIRSISATIIDPGPWEGPEEDEIWQGETDDRFSFGPWFITRTHAGARVRASYSYLDLHGCLDGVGSVWEGGDGSPGGLENSEEDNRDRDRDPGTVYDRVHWTVIEVPVRDVVAIALSTELDLALVISAKVEFEGQRDQRSHLAVRPLRFLDGTPHPCAKVPTMRFSVTGISVLHTTRVQSLGDYLLLWFGRGRMVGVSALYLIAWKQGSITLLRECPLGEYGTVHLISNDVLALVQLDPPGIELCRLSNLIKAAEGSSNDEPRMDKLCTLLLPPLRQRQDTGARALLSSASCVGGYTGHQTFSCGPWPESHSASLGRRQMLRQSMNDRIVKVMMHIRGCEGPGPTRTIEVVVRCATLLAYADGARAVPTAPTTIAADTESSIGGGDAQSALAQGQAVMGGANADNDTEGGTSDDVVPWDAWGPRETTASDYTPAARTVFGERMAVTKLLSHQVCICDYNPYRIRKARASTAKRGHGGVGCGDYYEEEERDEEEGNADTFHPKVTRRITEGSTLQGGQWFEEDVTTSLPHLDIEVDLPQGLPGHTGIYMEQDQILLRVGDIDQIVTGKPYRRKGYRESEGFALYSM